MPFCPDCRYEYQPGVSECPDCRKRLVEKLAVDPPPGNIRFVPLPDLPGRVYAEMVKGALEQRGIPSYVRSDGATDGFSAVGTMILDKGFKLYVPENRLDECLDIQRQMMDPI